MGLVTITPNKSSIGWGFDCRVDLLSRIRSIRAIPVILPKLPCRTTSPGSFWKSQIRLAAFHAIKCAVTPGCFGGLASLPETTLAIPERTGRVLPAMWGVTSDRCIRRAFFVWPGQNNRTLVHTVTLSHNANQDSWMRRDPSMKNRLEIMGTSMLDKLMFTKF